jgi:MFS family permease
VDRRDFMPITPPTKFWRLRLPVAVYALGLTSLLNDFAGDMIYPLLPLFLSTSLGVGAVALGMIEGVAEMMASVLRLVAGHLSDRSQRRKPFVVAGYIIASVARPFLAFAGNTGTVFAVRLVDRFGKGMRSSPRDAFIADLVAPRDRGRAFGVHEGMDHAGAVLGPLAASGLIGLGFALPEVFLWSAVPASIACLVVVFLVREAPRAVRGGLTAPAPPSVPEQAAPPLPTRRPFVGYLVAVGVFSLSASTDAFLILRAHDLGLATAAVPVLWAFHNAIRAVTTSLGGALADRFGRRRTLAAAWVVYAAVYAGFAVADSLTDIVVLFAVYPLYYALSGGAQKALVADLVAPAARARGYGIYYLCEGLMLLPASVLFGALYQRFGAPTAFVTGAILALLGAALLPLSRVRQRVPARADSRTSA